MTCLRWILGYMKLVIWRKIGLSGDCLCTALPTNSGGCYCWTGLDWLIIMRIEGRNSTNARYEARLDAGAEETWSAISGNYHINIGRLR